MAIDTDISGQWRTQTARRIADELALDPVHERVAKVSSLLHAFSCPDVHSDFGDVKRALSSQGVIVCSPRDDISRREVIELRLDSASTPAPTTEGKVGSVRVTCWKQGAVGATEVLREGGVHLDRSESDILWFDVDPLGPDPSVASIHELTSRLQPHCQGLKETMVRDLLTPDMQPKSETYGDERTGIRSVSVSALIAREVPDEDDEFDGFDEQLLTQMVELVVGPGWIITCWHPCHVLVGGGRVQPSVALPRELFLSHVAYRWVHEPLDPSRAGAAKEASDLATYLARSLVAT